MASFTGRAEHSIDSKGRVPVPARMRRALRPEAQETFMATRGIERCIYLYPMDYWASDIEPQLDALNQFQPESRHFVRMLGMWAEEVTLDAQGRIALPRDLADFAGLQPGGKAQISGAFRRIEVWDPDTFRAYLNEQQDQYEDLAQRVMG